MTHCYTNYTNSPYKNIPEELLNGFTMETKVPILVWWIDGTTDSSDLNWTDKMIDEYRERFTANNIKNSKEGNSPYGHDCVSRMLEALEKYDIRNKVVAVIGTIIPWIEAILLNMGNKVITIEYNVPVTSYPNLKCENYFEYYEKCKNIFDCVVTFSSIEHSGLGRYGDPLNPNGDLETMKTIKNSLKQNGLLIWGAPVGHDALVWNAHRVYGKLRLPLLFDGFAELEWFGPSKEHLLNSKLENNGYHPIVILQK